MAGIYIHIPFCVKKCLYCDFFSGNQLYLIDNYIEALNNELIFRKEYLEMYSINSIYFGGGTPSLLKIEHVSKILNTIFRNYDVNHDAEITFECNPEDMKERYVDDLYLNSVNRISLGIQFLDDTVLKKFNRGHNKVQIIRAVEIINNSKFNNLSIDLIYNVPGISNEFLFTSLVQLMNFDIKHISAYSLTISKNSKLYWYERNKNFIVNGEEEFLEQNLLINDFLKYRNYIQYEISNYAKTGFISKHNSLYWNREPYLGVGVSAHSFNLFSRQWNHKNIKRYIRELTIINNFNSFEIEFLNEVEKYNEYVILKLRTFDGLSLSYVKYNFNQNIYSHFLTTITKLVEKGHFMVKDTLFVPKESDLLVSDYIAKYLIL